MLVDICLRVCVFNGPVWSLRSVDMVVVGEQRAGSSMEKLCSSHRAAGGDVGPTCADFLPHATCCALQTTTQRQQNTLRPSKNQSPVQSSAERTSLTSYLPSGLCCVIAAYCPPAKISRTRSHLRPTAIASLVAVYPSSTLDTVKLAVIFTAHPTTA